MTNTADVWRTQRSATSQPKNRYGKAESNVERARTGGSLHCAGRCIQRRIGRLPNLRRCRVYHHTCRMRRVARYNRILQGLRRHGIRPSNCTYQEIIRQTTMRTDQEIIQQTNELARILYRLRGYVVNEGYRFDKATHPHEREAWQGACEAQILLTGTDPNDALENEED